MFVGKIKILHIITGLGRGGAELMLSRLLQYMGDSRYENIVISLTNKGALGKELEMMGVRVIALNVDIGFKLVSVFRLVRLIRKIKPDLVQTWMYHADLLGGIAAKLAGRFKVIWGIRQTNLSPALNSRYTLLVARLCAKISAWLPEMIICCADSAKESHIAIGYKAKNMRVIENGFDTNRFKPNLDARRLIRDELNIDEDDILIGMVARYDPQKNHKGFLKVVDELKNSTQPIRFVLCGDGIVLGNDNFKEMLIQCGVLDSVILLGQRDDVAKVMCALDILVSPSIGEGFPNVIGEAMSTGVPCVVTNVGASEKLLGNYGIVVEANSHEELVQGIVKMIGLSTKERKMLGQKARERIIKVFSIGPVVRKYTDSYNEILDKL